MVTRKTIVQNAELKAAIIAISGLLCEAALL